ncbi:unnamed protein product [Ectocarpus sp. 6 AP-2014]
MSRFAIRNIKVAEKAASRLSAPSAVVDRVLGYLRKAIKELESPKKRITAVKRAPTGRAPPVRSKVRAPPVQSKVRAPPVRTKVRAPPVRTKVTWKSRLEQWKQGKNLPRITSSVFWETSRMHNGGLSEFKQKTTPASKHLPLSTRADSSAFAQHVRGKKSTVAFQNLGNTATLVAPPHRPGSNKNYSHIATFYKHASPGEIKDLWRTVAKEVEKKMKKGESVYVSTHGTGVPWLHVRIESTPKYYVSELKNT